MKTEGNTNSSAIVIILLFIIGALACIWGIASANGAPFWALIGTGSVLIAVSACLVIKKYRTKKEASSSDSYTEYLYLEKESARITLENYKLNVRQAENIRKKLLALENSHGSIVDAKQFQSEYEKLQTELDYALSRIETCKRQHEEDVEKGLIGDK